MTKTNVGEDLRPVRDVTASVVLEFYKRFLIVHVIAKRFASSDGSARGARVARVARVARIAEVARSFIVTDDRSGVGRWISTAGRFALRGRHAGRDAKV